MKWLAIALLLGGTFTHTGPAPAFANERPSGSATSSTVEGIPAARVRKGTFERTVESIGELKAYRSSIILSTQRATVTKLVAEGTAVKKGDPVIWLDREEKETKLKEKQDEKALAEKDLASAKETYTLEEAQNHFSLQSEQAKVELAEQKYQDALQKLDTERVLVEKGISPRSNLDEAELASLSASVELRNARINLRKTEENLTSNLRVKQTDIDKAQLDVDKAVRDIAEVQGELDAAILRAPTDGEVSYLKIWKNGTNAKIAEGDSVWDNLSLVEMPDRSRMIAVIPVNELDIASVEAGQAAVLTLDAMPGRTFSGKVERKSIVPIDSSQQGGGGRRGGGGNGQQQQSGPREFEVTIALDENEPMFFQGMTAAARITIGSLDSAIMIPLEALALRESTVGVYRSMTDFVPVDVLQTNSSDAAVAGDVHEGDLVLLRDPTVSLEDSIARGKSALRAVFDKLQKQHSIAGGGEAKPGGGEGGERRRRGDGQGRRKRPEGEAAPAAAAAPEVGSTS